MRKRAKSSRPSLQTCSCKVIWSARSQQVCPGYVVGLARWEQYSDWSGVKPFRASFSRANGYGCRHKPLSPASGHAPRRGSSRVPARESSVLLVLWYFGTREPGSEPLAATAILLADALTHNLIPLILTRTRFCEGIQLLSLLESWREPWRSEGFHGSRVPSPADLTGIERKQVEQVTSTLVPAPRGPILTSCCANIPVDLHILIPPRGSPQQPRAHRILFQDRTTLQSFHGSCLASSDS